MTHDPPSRAQRLRARWPDLLGLAWVVGAALALLGPALARGASFGPFISLDQFGLSYNAHVIVTSSQRGDIVNAMNVWSALSWRQVHAGHLPLWNPYSALGMPLAFNWQSAPFSLPSLVGYLFPLRLSFSVQTIVTLLIAGTGAYALARMLRLGALASAFAATAFELSGPMVGWLGWPHTAVMAWGGWLFAAALYVIRGKQRRALPIALMAVVVACAVYVGQPEVLGLMGMALLLFLAVYLGLRSRPHFGGGAVARPALDLALGGVAGLALAAPLLLPGLQLEQGSLRNAIPPDQGLPAHNLVYLLFQGYDGLPIGGNHWFGYFFYVETAAYVGVAALVMVLLAACTRWRRPEVPAFGAVAIVMFAIAYVGPLNSFLDGLPAIGHILWHRSLLPMALALALLAGQGVDVLVRHWRDSRVQVIALCGFGAVAVIVAGQWLFGSGHLTHAELVLRDRSYTGPVVGTVIGLMTIGALVLARRHFGDAPDVRSPWKRVGVWGGLALLVGQTAFLLGAGEPLMASSSSYFAESPSEVALQHTVGDSTVAFGTNTIVCTGLGITPNVNAFFGVHELALYDPLVPAAYFTAFRRQTGRSAGVPGFYSYCPAIDSVPLAQLYGARYILVPASVRGPAGTTFVSHLNGETLYRVPKAYPATLVTATHPAGTPVAVEHPNPSTWQLVVHAASPGTLHLRLTSVPGWNATDNGHATTVRTYEGIMLQVAVPAGTSTVVLHYWPKTFSVGIIIAVTTFAILIAVLLIETSLELRRRARTSADTKSSSGSSLPQPHPLSIRAHPSR